MLLCSNITNLILVGDKSYELEKKTITYNMERNVHRTGTDKVNFNIDYEILAFFLRTLTECFVNK